MVPVNEYFERIYKYTHNYIYEEKNGYNIVTFSRLTLPQWKQLLGFDVLFIASTGLLEVSLNSAFCFLAKEHLQRQLHNKAVMAAFGL